MADLARNRDKRLLKLGMDGNSIVLRKGTSEDLLNSGLEIFQKGHSGTGKTPRGKERKGGVRVDSRGSCWRVSPRQLQGRPIRPVAAPRAAADKDPSRDLAARRASTQSPSSSPNARGLIRSPAPAPPAWERHYRHAVGCRAEPWRALKIRE